LAQHALSPAKALDAVSIAAATKPIVVILVMVNAQTGAMRNCSIVFADELNFIHILPRCYF
jgi:hypothetical protein